MLDHEGNVKDKHHSTSIITEEIDVHKDMVAFTVMNEVEINFTNENISIEILNSNIIKNLNINVINNLAKS